jgi:chromosome segregation ATPase
MAADLTTIVQTVVSGVAAGAASGATSILAWARDIRKRLGVLEEKVGSSEEPKTGLHQTVWAAEETLKRLSRKIESWEDDPPDWAKRLISRSRTSSTMGLEHLTEVEGRVDQKIRTFNERVKGVEEELNETISRLRKVEQELGGFENAVSREEYERDARAKAADLHRIRENLAAANGMLRGVMAAMGIADEKKDPRTR